MTEHGIKRTGTAMRASQLATTLAVVGSLWAPASSVLAEETERNALITQAVELSGLNDQLAQSPAMIRAQLHARQS